MTAQTRRVWLLYLGFGLVMAVGLCWQFGLHWPLEARGLAPVGAGGSQREVLLLDVASVEDFDDVLPQPRCVVLLHMDWSPHCSLARLSVERVATQFHHDNPQRLLPFYRVDLTEQQSELTNRFRRYLQDNGLADSMAYTGNGAVLWLRHGKVADHLESGFAATDDVLLERTQALVDSG